MGRPELSKKPMTIRFDGAPPTTTTELAANRYPPQSTDPLNIGYVSIAKWTEIFNVSKSSLTLPPA